MTSQRLTSLLNRSNWGGPDFSRLCRVCLGDDTYIRMMKDRYSTGCKMCSRYFTVNRWCTGANGQFKATLVCQPCALSRNICQTCAQHMDGRLAVPVPDDVTPKNDASRWRQRRSTGARGAVAGSGRAAALRAEQLSVCKLWLKNKCKRGRNCPYSHERTAHPADRPAGESSENSASSSPTPALDRSF